MKYQQPEFSEETIAALEELGQALRAVHDRLVDEGYTLIDGTYVAPKND